MLIAIAHKSNISRKLVSPVVLRGYEKKVQFSRTRSSSYLCVWVRSGRNFGFGEYISMAYKYHRAEIP